MQAFARWLFDVCMVGLALAILVGLFHVAAVVWEGEQTAIGRMP